MKLSILIPSLEKRKPKLDRLIASIKKQKVSDIELLTSTDNGQATIGLKRNSLLNQAVGEYVVFIDDDDRISPDYIEEVMVGINLGVDCCSLVGEITTDGKGPKMFVHSLEYDHYFESENVYYRPPNHLNVIRRHLIMDFKFPEINFGEDTDWAMQVSDSGALQNEYKIKKTIYFYDYLTTKV